MRAERQQQARVAPTLFEPFEREAGGDDVGPLAPVLLRDGQAREPELSDGPPHLRIPATVAVACIRVRPDDLLGEVAHGGAEGKLLVCEGEAERHGLTGRRDGEGALSSLGAQRAA